VELSPQGDQLIYTYDPHNQDTGIAELLRAIDDAGLLLKDINTSQSSLEEIFINLVNAKS
jgi:ABC-2 type transport system ATP-binding protein